MTELQRKPKNNSKRKHAESNNWKMFSDNTKYPFHRKKKITLENKRRKRLMLFVWVAKSLIM